MHWLKRIRRALAAQLNEALDEDEPAPAVAALAEVEARLARLGQALAEARAHSRRLELGGAGAEAVAAEHAWQAELHTATQALTQQRDALRQALAEARRHSTRLAWREELDRATPELARQVEATLRQADALAAREAWKRGCDDPDA